MTHRSRLIVTGATISACLFVLPPAVAEPVVKYLSPFEYNADETIDLGRKRLWAGGDLVHAIEVCGPEGEYDCLSLYDSFALSVPRKGVPNGTKWRIGKFTFVAVGGGPIRLGGRDLNATFIETIVDGAPEGRASVRAVYDAKYGLVAWAHLHWEFNPATQTTNAYPTLTEPVFAKDIGLWPRRR